MADLFEMLDPAAAADRFGRGPVAAAPYHDPAWYADEVEAIFRRSWLHLGHVSEVPEPGCFVRRELAFARASLLVVHGRDGTIRAFHNACTHRGTQLTQERAGKRGQFSCPYHMWTFGNDGRLVSAPDFERFHVDKADCALRQVPLDVLGGLIFVHLAPDPAGGVREQFGALAARFDELPAATADRTLEFEYEIEANWKTNFDNFQENYHLRFIHPRTGAAAIGPENPMGYPTHYGFAGEHRSQALWKNPAPPPLPPTLTAGLARAAGLALPNRETFAKVDFKLFPAFHVVWLSPDQMYTHTHTPLGPTRTLGQVRFYHCGPPRNATHAWLRELQAMSIRDVLVEDRHAVEAAQRGLSSGAIERINLQDHEVLVRHLHQQVTARVEAWRARQAAAA